MTLLCDLAQLGSSLHRTLVKDIQLPEALLNGEHIQAIMAHENYHLPIEFCYQRGAPKSTAKLCPHAVETLKGNALGQACQANCPSKDHESDFICPMAFWGLNRVIEWHQYRPEHSQELHGHDYGLMNEPSDREGKLDIGGRILMAASAKISSKSMKKLDQKVTHVSSWKDWKTQIADFKPDTLLLMVHTETKNPKLPRMEINREFLDPPNIHKSGLVPAKPSHPLVLLLGCGTRYAKVPSHSLAAQFRQEGAAIVVSTLAELLAKHAPPLAEAILAELARTAPAPRSFGEIMLAIKRRGLLEGLPIALALLAYGDADWWV